MSLFEKVTVFIFFAAGCCLSAIHLRKNGIWGIPTIEQLSSKERKVDLKLFLAAMILFIIGIIFAVILKYSQ